MCPLVTQMLLPAGDMTTGLPGALDVLHQLAKRQLQNAASHGSAALRVAGGWLRTTAQMVKGSLLESIGPKARLQINAVSQIGAWMKRRTKRRTWLFCS